MRARAWHTEYMHAELLGTELLYRQARDHLGPLLMDACTSMSMYGQQDSSVLSTGKAALTRRVSHLPGAASALVAHVIH